MKPVAMEASLNLHLAGAAGATAVFLSGGGCIRGAGWDGDKCLASCLDGGLPGTTTGQKTCRAWVSSLRPGSPWQPPALLELRMEEMQRTELVLMAKQAFGWWHSSAEHQGLQRMGVSLD